LSTRFSRVIIRERQKQIGWNTKRPTLIFFLGPTKPLQLYG
jgi:hypothetical protein